MTRQFSPDSAAAVPVVPVASDGLEAALSTLPPEQADWARRIGFAAGLGETCALPDGQGNIGAVLAGRGTADLRARKRFALGAALAALPGGLYRLDLDAGQMPMAEREETALGFLLAGYRFDLYKGSPAPKVRLVVPEGLDADALETIAAGEWLTRDLINTAPNDMGPQELEGAARALAERFGAFIAVTAGDDLLTANFPLIHTVGRASDRAPRLIDMSWGSRGPKITLVGKGVCFDTGGLNLKPGSSMGLMKKDMGGAANVLGLAHMIMASELPVQLRVLIPAVENSVSANSFRPQDILTSRKGLTVEINNTDAEGRLVLADALTLASEDDPDLIVSMATLTGAARVALGPDIAPYFTDDDGVATSLDLSARRMADPVWRLPFHDPYEAMIEPGIADLDNAPKGGFAGSITAALFLRRFVADQDRYIHFDIYGWQPTAAPGRPKGGALQGARAFFSALPDMMDL